MAASKGWRLTKQLTEAPKCKSLDLLLSKVTAFLDYCCVIYLHSDMYSSQSLYSKAKLAGTVLNALDIMSKNSTRISKPWSRACNQSLTTIIRAQVL